ncbi:hypothetical protein VKT23_018286 [Stygiomarasmius scandens]|uniref:UDP-Glycosyltransferase/glycogen phosphorylase n=1 Tax=Marasmiellus scandens TaxID=2682957 RepID=A0ABR1IP91_9AGAR
MNVPAQMQKHILFHCIPGWGHYKPIFPLAVQVLQSRPNVIITVLIQVTVYPKLLAEFDKLPPGVQEDVRARFNVIDISGVPQNPLVPLLSFEPTFQAIWNGEPIKCRSSGKEYTLLKPTVAVMDPFAGYAIEAIRETAGSSFPIVTWGTSTAGSALRVFKEPGKEVDMKLIRYATEQELMPIMPRFVDEITGRVVSVPGVPPMYDYEYYPQEIPLVGNIFVEIARKYIPTTDGMFIASSSAYDGKSVEGMKEWFGARGKDIYPVGPLSLPGPPSSQEKGKAVVEFLDEMQAKCGEKSMSFGTVFWPKNPEKVWAVVEEILASGTPLVWAHPSPFCKVPEDKLKMFHDSEISFEAQWVPQETILSHPATGWFISHGGWNSIQEAMVYQVPQIYWPQAADQPPNAATVTFEHKAGFELIQVRTGERGTGRPYRFKDADLKDVPTFTVEAVREEIRDVLNKLKSDEGLVVRKNFEKMSKEFLSGWDEGGEARDSVERFLRKFVD